MKKTLLVLASALFGMSVGLSVYAADQAPAAAAPAPAFTECQKAEVVDLVTRAMVCFFPVAVWEEAQPLLIKRITAASTATCHPPVLLCSHFFMFTLHPPLPSASGWSHRFPHPAHFQWKFHTFLQNRF